MLQEHARKSNRKLAFPAAHAYAHARLPGAATGELHEPDGPPPERLLQAVWYHQRLLRDQLHCLDGLPLRVLHPGFWNHGAGPDFRGAVLQFGDEPPRTGDVEVDVVTGGWHSHAHAGNPAYQQVLLQVVWAPPRRHPGPLPTLVLQPVLDAPLAELSLWLGGEAARQMPEPVRGQCRNPLKDLSPAARTDLLRQAAITRFQAKAAHVAARARQAGWEQALWEGLFAGLGYTHNAWPMRRLAELRPLLVERNGPAPLSVRGLQARLLGTGGLLPAELTRTRAGTDDYLRRVWDEWWRERERFADRVLPRSLWRFQGLRPANHPQRRLALAAHWLAADTLPARLEQWLATPLEGAALLRALLKILTVERDEFWSWHWTFRSVTLPEPRPLLGATRATDLAINVILPWLWARAQAGRNDALRQVAEHRYLAWPAAEDNAILRLARQRLLGDATARSLETAAAQQGVLQIVHDFCNQSNAVCADCRFPELVRTLLG